jgi:hypothetical protein
MAKIKFSLEPNPTFKKEVSIPVPGEGYAPVEFIFKHRDREGFEALAARMGDITPVDFLLEIASGWNLDEPFDAEHLTKLTDRYLGAFQVIADTYFAELTKGTHRLGN